MNNELSFIDEIFKSKVEKYKKPRYLLSNFESETWILDLNKKEKILNFNILLNDGSMLTEKENNSILNTLKFWIVANTQPTKGIENGPRTIFRNIIQVLTIFDYLVMNGHITSKKGLRMLNADVFKIFLDKVASGLKFESIYELDQKLSNYLKAKIKTITENDILKYESICSNSKVDTDNLNLDNNELFLSKVWLLKNKMYIRKNVKNGCQTPSIQSIYNEIFKNTLITSFNVKCPIYEDLSINTDDLILSKEHNSIVERDYQTDFHLNEIDYNGYKNTIKSIGKLYVEDFGIQELSLPSANIFTTFDHKQQSVKAKGRFLTVPSTIVFDSVRKAIEFHFEFGEHLIESYKKLIDYSNIKKDDNIENYTECEISQIISSNLKEKGCNHWKLDNKNKFNNIRKNTSLYALIKIYFGATQVVVGATMARRQSELLSLKAGNCLDKENKYLLFHQSKSSKGLFGTKNTLALPIDDIAIQMIENIEKIHQIMNKTNNELFSPPKYKKIAESNVLTASLYNQNFDIFFDYIEAPLKNDKRYYLRQHQLRRFFAMSFFWGNGFGGMDTLRWFLGHTDIQHLYHYITESTDGAVLNNVKLQYVLENIDESESLKVLIKDKYNVTDYHLVDNEEIEYLISELLEDGKLIVEPEFIEDDNKKTYKIIVKVIDEVRND